MSNSSKTEVDGSSPLKSASTKAPFNTPEKSKGTPVKLWQHKASADNSLRLFGKIGDVQVAGFLRNGERGAFVAFVGKKQEDGNFTPVATANVVSNTAGIPKLRLVLVQTKEVVWVDVAFTVNKKLLVEMGLNEKLQDEKRKAHQVDRDKKQAAYQAKNS